MTTFSPETLVGIAFEPETGPTFRTSNGALGRNCACNLGGSGLGRMCCVDESFGIGLPGPEQFFHQAIVVDRLTQQLRLFGRDVAMRDLAGAHATPLVVRAVPR